MRYVMCRVTRILALILLLSAVLQAQGNLHINESAMRIQLLDTSTLVDMLVENTGRVAIPARVSLELVDPQGGVQSRANKEISLPPGRTNVNLSMPPAFAPKERTYHENLLWYRLRYSIVGVQPIGAAVEPIHGILSVSEAAPELFELHVAAPAVVKEGSRAAIQVRAVHPVTLRAIEGVLVQASLDLDKEDGKPLLTPAARTDRQGFATLNLSLPRMHANEASSRAEMNAEQPTSSANVPANASKTVSQFLSDVGIVANLHSPIPEDFTSENPSYYNKDAAAKTAADVTPSFKEVMKSKTIPRQGKSPAELDAERRRQIDALRRKGWLQ